MAQALTPTGPLLQNAPVAVTLTCTDVPRSVDFYTKKLGLKVGEVGEDHFEILCGGSSQIYVYLRNEAPKATNTVCAFRVNDLEATITNLRNNGVTFEEYDMPGLKTVDGIATIGDERVAWIKDPDGNTIGVGTY